MGGSRKNGEADGDEGGKSGHVWEDAATSGAAWEAVREDADGNLIVGSTEDPASKIRQRRERLAKTDYAQSSRRVARDMMRYLYIVIDASRWMRQSDAALGITGNANRLELVVNLVGHLVGEYFDQNPLSHIGLVWCCNGEAEMMTRLSGSVKAHRLALAAALQSTSGSNPNSGGEFSLQNGLEVAGRSLGHAPRHGSREILVVLGALSTCDPGNVLMETLPRLSKANIRVSSICLAAELYVCRKIADSTGGLLGVCLDRPHLRDLLLGQCIPPPSVRQLNSDGGTRKRTCTWVQMGFPKRETTDVPTLLHATRETKKLARTGYTCPRCKSKALELPADCAVCGLQLVLAPHLARSFHHLFPVPSFVEVPLTLDLTTTTNGIIVNGSKEAVPSIAPSSSMYAIPIPSEANSSTSQYTMILVPSGTTSKQVQIDSKLLVHSNEWDRSCYACLKAIGMEQASSDSLRFQCPDCHNIFCADCDAFLHGTLHNCPGCLCK